MPSLTLSAHVIRNSLKAHSGLGLLVAALLYLVCLTGVICIYFPELERWEQADIAENNQATPAHVQQALENYLADYARTHAQSAPETVWITLPEPAAPRLNIGAEDAQYFINADASLGPKVNHEWTHFITALHYSLTLPGIWGLTLVGILGVILTGMVISGLLAHPNMFKNAFSLRIARGARQRQVDFHNRIGVWATPFILVIAATGAMIGLLQIMLFIISTAFFKGDTTKITSDLFFVPPAKTAEAAKLVDVAAVLERFGQDHPTLLPFFINLHNPLTTGQSIELSAYMPNRLVYSESYLFDANGKLLKAQDFTNSTPGPVIFNSTYRLHFGHFGGLPVQILYTLLGLGMSFLCATGMNIWFRRQQQAGNAQPRLESAWISVVWGFPCAILFSAITDFWWWDHSTLVFWVSSAMVLAIALKYKNPVRLSFGLRSLIVLLTFSLLGLHIAVFKSAALSYGALTVNLLLMLLALAVGLPLCFRLIKQSPIFLGNQTRRNDRNETVTIIKN